MIGGIKKIGEFVRKETVLTVALLLAVISAFIVPPDSAYVDYIDFRTLAILFCLMTVVAGFSQQGMFGIIAKSMINRMGSLRAVTFVLTFMCFFFSMFITNDVSLITFVPMTLTVLGMAGEEVLARWMVPVITLQTIAANLGSMLTPIGNPQNLYLYGLAGVGAGQFIMWLLPYTIVSATLLIISIMLLKNKNADVSMKDTDDNSGQKAAPVNVLLYTILFIIALLVVARVLPWYVLTVLVLVTTFIIERNVLLKADYALLLTFVGFFIFTGNMGRIEPVALFLSGIADGREIGVGIITSQCISNVPAALLLSGFTHNIKNLALGVNIGGLGTLIASMASLISYKQYVNEVPDGKGKYFVTFTVYNVIFLIVLYACTKFI